MKKVFFNLSSDRADLIILILTSVSIKNSVNKNNNDLWDISVDEENYQRSIRIMSTYFFENKVRDRLENFRKPKRIEIISSLTGILILYIFFYFVSLNTNKEKVIWLYNSSATDILNGEFYRIVTSLFLHSDFLHLLSNSVFLFFFSIHIFAYTGSRIGWFLILFSGATGNFLNAVMYKYYHHSIGSSTAVFGALGILVSIHAYSQMNTSGLKQKTWIPIASGFALLCLTGTGGENVDIMAHLWGFITGVFTGFIYTINKALFLNSSVKNTLMILMVLWIILSWLVPLNT